jgi:putative membrane protein
MLIPGVSGGTMAIILGIYDELISAVSNIRKAFRRNVLLLITYAAGGGIGILLLSGSLLKLVTWAPIPSMYFFMGAIAASIPPLYRRVKQPVVSVRPDIVLDGAVIGRYPEKVRLRPVNILVALIGAAIGVGLKFLPPDLVPASDDLNIVAFIILFFAGVIIAIALILPGISGSYVLLVFGMYDVTLLAIKEMNVAYLAPLVVGVAVGTFATAKGIDTLMNRHPQFIFMLIIGFMLGSLYQIFPGLPSGIEIVIAPFTFVAGFLIIFLLVSFRKKNEG